MTSKIISLSGAELKVNYSGGGNAWLRNDGTSVIYASAATDIAAGADCVVSIPAGQAAPIYGANGTVYLLGTGSVLLVGSDYAECPFKMSTSSGGSTGVDTVARAAIEAHEGDADIHVSADEKAAWSIYKGYPEGGDCNNADKQGVYSVSANSANAPNSKYFTIAVDVAGNGDWITQTAITAETAPRIYRRVRINGTWGTWRDIADGGNADKVGGYTASSLQKFVGDRNTIHDCNDCTECGWYLFNGCGGHSPLNNGTTNSGTYFVLMTWQYNSSYICQTAMHIHGASALLGRTYTRCCNNGVWTDWDYLTRSADISALEARIAALEGKLAT